MSLIDILLIGISLSMDAFAVTVTNGMVCKNLKQSKAFMIPVFFGAFQGIMPALGCFTGCLFVNAITRFAGLFTFVILTVIGGKMIKDSFFPCSDNVFFPDNTFTYKILTLQAVATSIDAFAVGVTFCAVPMRLSVFSACFIIAITTFLLSSSALFLGKKAGNLFEKKSQLLGGIVLVLIGLKSLF